MPHPGSAARECSPVRPEYAPSNCIECNFTSLCDIVLMCDVTMQVPGQGSRSLLQALVCGQTATEHSTHLTGLLNMHFTPDNRSQRKLHKWAAANGDWLQRLPKRIGRACHTWQAGTCTDVLDRSSPNQMTMHVTKSTYDSTYLCVEMQLGQSRSDQPALLVLNIVFI